MHLSRADNRRKENTDLPSQPWNSESSGLYCRPVSLKKKPGFLYPALMLASSHSKHQNRQRVPFPSARFTSDGRGLTSVVIIVDLHYHTPRETGAEVELLIRAVQVADRGVADGLEGHVVLASADVVAGNIEPILVRVAVAFDTSLEMVAVWGRDGAVCGYVDRRGW